MPQVRGNDVHARFEALSRSLVLTKEELIDFLRRDVEIEPEIVPEVHR